MRRDYNKFLNICRGALIGTCMGLAVAVVSPIAVAKTSVVYAEDYTDRYYNGTADGTVNVRTGAGSDKDRVTYKGDYVQLKAGDKVRIIGEEVVAKGTSDEKIWYKIVITKGEDEIIGYSTSSYITRNENPVMVEPDPTPTPLPTPTPEPTPTKAPTPTPVATATPTEAPEEEEGGGVNGGIIAAIIIIILAGAALVFLKSKKAQAAGKAASRKLAQIKKAKIRDGADNSEENTVGRRKPEVKTKVNYRDTQAEQVYQDVYLKNNGEEAEDDRYSYISQGNAEEIKENAAKENEERKALRADIEELREHDLVIHKYFGKGEVYDNSDVRLIEVRFGSDVRFMNKDALAAKKLMKRCSDDTMRYHRRMSDRQDNGDYFE